MTPPVHGSTVSLKGRESLGLQKIALTGAVMCGRCAWWEKPGEEKEIVVKCSHIAFPPLSISGAPLRASVYSLV